MITSLEYYLNIQYPITLYPDSEGGYVAQIKDLLLLSHPR